MKFTFSQRGTTVVESLLVINIFVISFFGLLFISNYFYTKINLQNILHETIVCSIREKNKNFCIFEAKQKLSIVLFFGSLKQLTITKDNKYTKGQIMWDVLKLKKIIGVSHSYKLRNTIIKPTKRALL